MVYNGATGMELVPPLMSLCGFRTYQYLHIICWFRSSIISYQYFLTGCRGRKFRHVFRVQNRLDFDPVEAM